MTSTSELDSRLPSGSLRPRQCRGGYPAPGRSPHPFRTRQRLPPRDGRVLPPLVRGAEDDAALCTSALQLTRAHTAPTEPGRACRFSGPTVTSSRLGDRIFRARASAELRRDVQPIDQLGHELAIRSPQWLRCLGLGESPLRYGRWVRSECCVGGVVA